LSRFDVETFLELIGGRIHPVSMYGGSAPLLLRRAPNRLELLSGEIRPRSSSICHEGGPRHPAQSPQAARQVISILICILPSFSSSENNLKLNLIFWMSTECTG